VRRWTSCIPPPPRDDAPDDVRAKASFARAEASRLWLELLCVVDAPRDETSTERGNRIARLNDLAALAGLSPILFHLREFSLDLNHAVFTSPNPGKTLDSIIHGPPREGNPGRAFNERIAMAVGVQKKRWLGMTDEKACGEIAEKTRDPHIGRDAVRSIYENVMKEEKAAALMRVIAASQVMDATAADPIARDSAYKTMMRDMRRRASSKVHPKN